MKANLIRYEVPEYCSMPIDWTNLKNYPKAEDLTVTQWGWEFLRRNPEYIKDWNYFNSLPDYAVFEDGYSTNKIGKWRGTPIDNFPLDSFYTNPMALSGETPQAYRHRMEEMSDLIDSGEIIPYEEHIRDKYNLISKPLNPDFPMKEFDDISNEHIMPYSISHPDNFSDKDYFIDDVRYKYSKTRLPVGLIFDASKPIDKQLEEAKKNIDIFKRYFYSASQQS